MSDSSSDAPQQSLQIYIEPGQMAGVWANYAKVSHSPYEFTLDFVRLDFASTPPQGIVVARVSLSPLMVTQLIDVLRDNWAKYAEKAMPSEVYDHDEAAGRAPDEGPGSGRAETEDSAA